jgi:hypothetical protein
VRRGRRCDYGYPPLADRWSLPQANSKAKNRHGGRFLARARDRSGNTGANRGAVCEELERIARSARLNKRADAPISKGLYFKKLKFSPDNSFFPVFYHFFILLGVVCSSKGVRFTLITKWHLKIM